LARLDRRRPVGLDDRRRARIRVLGNWSAKVEYDYMDFGTKNLNMSFQKPANATFVINVNDRETLQVVKAGLNWRFGGPVVTKY
jgi:outer membrane immunogenic protein